MKIDCYVSTVEQEGRLFADTARRVGLDADISACPGWNMRDLVRHLAEIHLWAAAQISHRATRMWVHDLSELSTCWPDLATFWPSDSQLIDWYLETNLNLVHELTSAPADLQCRTFLPAPCPLAMWARRQAHEITIHRVDAENTGRAESVIDPVFAADGVDEMLVAFAPRASTFPIAAAGTIAVHAEDTDDRWSVVMTPSGISTVRGWASADTTIAGTASDLYLAVWNRGDDSTIKITGHRELLDTWHEGHRIRWSRSLHETT